MHVREIITNALLIWLPIDLLYLYCAGAWSDKNVIILNIEIFVLLCIPILGIYRVVEHYRRMRGSEL